MRTITALAILGLTLIACTDPQDTTPIAIAQLPLEVGNKWEYTKTFKGLVYSDETMTEITDTIDFTQDFTIQVTKDTTLGDTLTLKKVVKTPYYLATYKTNTEAGLKEYAYSRNSKKQSDQFLDNWIHKLQHPQNAVVDENKETITFYEDPRLEYSYPMTIGTKWVYFSSDFPHQHKVTKEVIGFENIAAAGRVFTCMKIKFTYEPVGSFEGIEITEWVAYEGKIKEEIKAKLPLVSDTGEEIGYISSISTTILTSLNVK